MKIKHIAVLIVLTIIALTTVLVLKNKSENSKLEHVQKALINIDSAEILIKQVDRKFLTELDESRYLYTYGYIRYRQGHPDKAIRYYLKAYDKLVQSGQEKTAVNERYDILTGLGAFYHKYKSYGLALKYYNRALEGDALGMNESLLRYNIALTYSKTGQDSASIANLVLAYNVAKDHEDYSFLARVANKIGTVNRDNGLYRDALDRLFVVVNNKEHITDRELARTYHNLGTVYMEMKDFPKAEEYFTRSLEIRQDDFITTLDMAEMKFKQGNYKAALIYAESAKKQYPESKLDPDNYKLFALMGEIFEKHDDLNQALAYERTYREHDTRFKAIQQEQIDENARFWVEAITAEHFQEKQKGWDYEQLPWVLGSVLVWLFWQLFVRLRKSKSVKSKLDNQIQAIRDRGDA